MKEIVVLSGKGGTGKTMITGSFAYLASKKVLADCDVDASDLHLLLDTTTINRKEFWSGRVAYIDEGKCTRCGLCQQLCRFNAISNFRVDPISCEGCAFCSRICPVRAITMEKNMSGFYFISYTKYGPLVYAQLGITQENSGKLVALVRQQAKQIAEKEKSSLIISDGPPGIGCPVISSLTGANLTLIVTEPTVSGAHDLERVLALCHHFGVPTLVCINKYDLNEENTRQIKSYCHGQGVEIAGMVPFDNIVIESINQGIPIAEVSGGAVTQAIENMWHAILARLNGHGKE